MRQASDSPFRLGGACRVLIVVPSVVTVGFGAWHFTVPSTWNWYGAMVPDATELVLAVRAINFLFSLLMVLHGGITIAVALHRPTERFALRLMLGASIVLWTSRVVLQVVYPQGTAIAGVAPAMLGTFVAAWLAYVSALVLLVRAERRVRSSEDDGARGDAAAERTANKAKTSKRAK